MSRIADLDAFDFKILASLQRDGRLGNQELADQVHLSPSQCSRRRMRLEEMGVIDRYAALLAPALLGLDVTVFVKVTLAPHTSENSRRFAELVQRTDCIVEAHAVTGDGDYLLKLIVPDLKALAEIINDTLLRNESVRQLNSTVVLDTLKCVTQLPVPGGTDAFKSHTVRSGR